MMQITLKPTRNMKSSESAFQITIFWYFPTHAQVSRSGNES